MDQHLSPTDAVAYTGLTRRTLIRDFNAGTLKGYRVGSNRFYVVTDDYLEAKGIEAKTPAIEARSLPVTEDSLTETDPDELVMLRVRCAMLEREVAWLRGVVERREEVPILQLAPPKQKQPSIIARLLGAMGRGETRTQTRPHSWLAPAQGEPPTPSE
ncbi:MAG: hypothetical protein WC683_08655 [bacterium]